MSIRVFLGLLASILSATAAFGQGFAGLGTDADGFKKVIPGREISFPKDYGIHEGFRIEWWYITANLRSENGKSIGLQWTLFRQASSPTQRPGNWSSTEFWMGHAAITTADNHLYAEKLARGGSGQAGARGSSIDVWIDDWVFRADSENELTLAAAGDGFSYSLDMQPSGQEILHGQDGFSVKSEQGQASYYFSHPFLKASGQVSIDGEVFTVAGDAWLDREWSSQPLADNQEGWDWFSIKFDDGNRLMAFSLRDALGGSYVSGSWISKDGAVTSLAGADIQLKPVAQSRIADRLVPTAWRVAVPSRKIELEVSALNSDSWMATSIPYWEGPVRVSGSHEASGYLEMTGY